MEGGVRETLVKSPIDYEVKWLEKWREARIFEADPSEDKPKFFICVPYSYQNGPLHLGHGFTFTRGDAYARFKRMQGYNVLFPWAWHWTGEAVAGTSERLKRGDPAVRRMLLEIDGVPEEMLEKFTDPAFVTQYYTSENKPVVEAMGYSVDWRREFYTTDLHPYYSKFITWQYLVLRERGYVTMGRHPVVWCPYDKSPTGDHDRLVGEGVSPEEYTIVLFKMDDLYLAAATLRPETIFGATNIWINPNHDYVVVEVEDKRWVVSQRAAEKLRPQTNIRIISRIDPGELVGRLAKTPLTGKKIPIFPADLVDPGFGTGVVYSVPSHAPYDYAGIVALRSNKERIERYGIKELVESIRPISIIKVPGYGEHPAVEEVEKAGIRSDTDPRLEEATKKVYSKEFHEGVMRENCGEFSGMRVSEARDKVGERLIELGLGDKMWELPEKVVCRCGTECIVKIVENQWFLRYSDPAWKEKVKNHINHMTILPEEARSWFLNVVDWLRDWACARKTGLGTKLPWDPEWIVETLSDSTIYPALYTISKYLNQGEVKAEHLTPETLNYIFLGRGDPEKISNQVGIRRDLLEQMRKEFLYWYPVDMRISAKELVPNHLTFYLFHHIAIFEEKHWPRGIGVNGMINIEGKKMSKSKGNFIPLRQAIQRHGADATRATLLLAAEDMDDPDWRERNAEEVKNMIQQFLKIVREASSINPSKNHDVDRWLLSRLQRKIKSITEWMEELKTRKACNEALYGLYNDWRWYIRRTGGKVSDSGRRFIDSWIRLLAPFIPFACEEAWSIIGGRGFVSLAEWPKVDEDLIDEEAELSEELIIKVLEDARNIMEVMKEKPKKMIIYSANKEKLSLLEQALKVSSSGLGKALGELARWIAMNLPSLKKHADSISKIMLDVTSSLTPRYSPNHILSVAKREHEIYVEAAEFMGRELGLNVKVYMEGEERIYDPKNKSKSALPLRPGIYLE